MGGVPSCNCNCKNKNNENEIIFPEKTKSDPKYENETLSSRLEKEETNISTSNSRNTTSKDKCEAHLMNPSFLEHSQRAVLRGDNGIINEESEDNASDNSQHINMEIYEDRLSISDIDNKSLKEEQIQQTAKINKRSQIPKDEQNDVLENDDGSDEIHISNNGDNKNKNGIVSSQSTDRKLFSTIMDDKPNNHCNPKDETVIICDDDNYINNNVQQENNYKVNFTDISEIKNVSPPNELASKITNTNHIHECKCETPIPNYTNKANNIPINDNMSCNTKLFEISNASFVIENTSLQTKQFDSQSTRKVQSNLFTLSPSRSSNANKTFVNAHQQHPILSEESFNIQLMKDPKVVQSCLNQTEIVGVVNKKKKRKGVIKMNNLKKIRKYADRNIIYFSNIQKINEIEKGNVVQVNRFCTLNSLNELCLYKTKEQFLLSQKASDVVNVKEISKVELVPKKRLEITLTEKGMKFSLETENEEIAQTWYNILVKYIK